MRGPVLEVGLETSGGTPTSPLLAPRLIPKTLGSHHSSGSPPMSWVPAASTAASSGDPVNSPTLEARFFLRGGTDTLGIRG